jgi:hypothetical protein
MPGFGFIVINYFHLYLFTAGYETFGGGDKTDSRFGVALLWHLENTNQIVQYHALVIVNNAVIIMVFGIYSVGIQFK